MVGSSKFLKTIILASRALGTISDIALVRLNDQRLCRRELCCILFGCTDKVDIAPTQKESINKATTNKATVY